MCNWTRSSVAYTGMHRVPLLLVFSVAALAQPSRQDPLDTAIQAVWKANADGRFQDAVANREQARTLLQRKPADSPEFANWAEQVAWIYQSSGLNAQSRAVLRDALARSGPLGESHPSHIAMLSALGESWRQDGNLLKAVGYLEQAATAQAAALDAAPALSAGSIVALSNGPSFGRYAGGGNLGNAIYAYTRLADLYQQLGRPDAVAATTAKIRTLASNDQTALAQFCEQHGQLEEALAIYKKLAEQAADPQAKAYAWQAVASVDARRQHYTDAISDIQQAIAAAESSGNPGAANQTLWMKQALAGYMRSAGKLDLADQVYQQLLQQSGGGPQEAQMLEAYALFLADTKRGAQGESLLKDYLASGSYLDPQQQANVFYNLANVAQMMGNPKSADEYRKAAQAAQPQATPVGPTRFAEELQKLQIAIGENRVEDAYGLALDAIDSATSAGEGQQIGWQVLNLANQLVIKREPAKAQPLFDRLMSRAQDWSVESMQPLIVATRNYIQFLMYQPDRLGEVPAAIEQYRKILTDANGSDSGSLAEPLRLELGFEQSYSQWQNADATARDLLELQESLSGNTSAPYLNDLQAAARMYQAAGDPARALPLFRKAITLADLQATPDDRRPAQARMEAALALVGAAQFDEAEKLGEEAVTLGQSLHALEPQLVSQLEQIRRMKQAALTASGRRIDQ